MDGDLHEGCASAEREAAVSQGGGDRRRGRNSARQTARTLSVKGLARPEAGAGESLERLPTAGSPEIPEEEASPSPGVKENVQGLEGAGARSVESSTAGGLKTVQPLNGATQRPSVRRSGRKKGHQARTEG